MTRETQPSKKQRKGPEVFRGAFDVPVTPKAPSSPAPMRGGGGRPRSSSLPVPPLAPRPPEARAAAGGSLMEMEALDASPPGGGLTQLPSLGPLHPRDRLLTKKQLSGTEERPSAADHTPSRPQVVSSKPPLPPMPMDSSPLHRPKQRKKPRPTPAPNNAHPLDDSNSSEDSVLEELRPLPNPEQGVKEALRLLGNEDWNVKCDGLLTVRRLAMYHPDVLTPHLHTVVIAAEKEVGFSF